MEEGVEVIPALGQRTPDTLAYPIRSGGRVTFEPGGQIEYASAPHPTTDLLMEDVDRAWGLLGDRFWAHGVCLLSLGIDPWHRVGTIPQQLEEGRYQRMSEYFEARGPAGATMMRNTSAIQVNLDTGTGRVRWERWVAANLLSPILTAMFAASPGSRARSLRARAWQSLDPTRTGFPKWERLGEVDPVEDTLDRALSADVMFVRRGQLTILGQRGWSFREWMREGHHVAGPPRRSDLETHLTTVFTEVRPQNGRLELRAVDGLPQRWWPVPVLVAGAVLYDPDARREIIERLGGNAPRFDEMWRTAATAGLADPDLRRTAMTVSDLTLAAAKRHIGTFAASHISIAEDFFDHLTVKGKSPADLLEQSLRIPGAALAWAAPEHALEGVA
jgi:glutamate--cysteine ligase